MGRLKTLIVAATLALVGHASAGERMDARWRERIASDVATHINDAFGRTDRSRGKLTERDVKLKVRAAKPGDMLTHRFTFVAKVDGKKLTGAGAVRVIDRSAFVTKMKLAR